MKIICLNGWGGKLHGELIDYVVREDPDILCLQEVVHTPKTTKDWLTYRDGDHVLAQRANFFRDVAEALPDHFAQFCQSAQGELWDGDVEIPSRWGLATFVRHSLPIIEQVQGFVHGEFSPHSYGDHPRPRLAHAVRVYDYEQDRSLCVAHMHGLRDLAGKMDTPARLAQAQRLATLLRGIAKPNEPIVFCGDFNIEPDSETFAVLADLGLQDLVTARGFTSTRTSHYPKAGRFADYMLVNSLVEVLRFEVVTDPEVSDHCPLLLEM
ncbi:endonuclease/exonuclease/phosphatase family protein [Aliirhizobium terrae]|uniref:endonuclease/exonuclease/phosphatase family protein n=1 Tax=Terrirhizobium terrae TaxID=2926709 RepID=UPI002578B69C|nr:endonuclease/exonuclease/phosphatase family protein [Rhizobium sp. CC-CFT758]WJH40724.1 endonuclease/exonuclease/phosphatase family protein [Rhizobium sp. CC-CFT758]